MKLVESFKDLGFDTENTTLLTFALDEPKSLLGKHGDMTHFSIFRSVASSFEEGCGIFIVLLDTTSEISNFKPSKIPDGSLRYSERSNQLFLVSYTVDTFNILAPKEKIWIVLGDSPCDLTSVLLKHFMKRRPLLGSCIKSRSNAKVSEMVRLVDVVQLAVEKLLGGIPVEQGMQGNTELHVVALFFVRASIFVKP